MLLHNLHRFMNEVFKETWYKQLNEAAQFPVHCVPLSDILAHYNIRHVNLFSLDVEGGELTVLESLDWNCFTFDVAVIELDRTNPAKDERVRSFMASAGYPQHSHVDRNGWFVRESCKPSAAPGVR
jgi:hypothetical protein